MRHMEKEQSKPLHARTLNIPVQASLDLSHNRNKTYMLLFDKLVLKKPQSWTNKNS